MRSNPFFRRITGILLTGGMLAVSCTHKSNEHAVTPAISFSKDILPIFTASCATNTTCHIGAYNLNDHIDLTDSLAYSTITTQHLVNTATPTASLLYAEISNGDMPQPPNSPLPAAQITLVLNWIQQGAKNN